VRAARVPPQSCVSVAVVRSSPSASRSKVPVSGLPAASKNPTEAPRHRPRCRLWPSGPNTSASVSSSTQMTSASPLRVWRIYWRKKAFPESRRESQRKQDAVSGPIRSRSGHHRGYNRRKEHARTSSARCVTLGGCPCWVHGSRRPSIAYLTNELGHDLLGEDLQLPLDDWQRGEALLDPPDQIAGIAGLDHLRELPFNGSVLKVEMTA
jgi:hypothetical protein